MAFAGMFLGTVFIIIVLIVYFIAFVELIIAIILTVKKHKKAAAVLYILAGIPAVITLIVVLISAYKLNFPEYKNADGETIRIAKSDIEMMKTLIRNDDMKSLDALLDSRPNLIHYEDINHITLLEYGLRNSNVEIMQIAADHGAKFDDPRIHAFLVYDYSLERFFDQDYWVFAYTNNDKPEPKVTQGVTTDEMIDAARFAIEHGAKVVWNNKLQPDMTYDFPDAVENWIKSDGVVSDKDQELLNLAKSAMN